MEADAETIKKRQNTEIDHGLKLLAKSSMIVFVGLFLSKLFTYGYKIIVARWFSPEVYGVFSLSIMVLSLFVAIFSFGFSEGLVRFIPLYRNKENSSKIGYLYKTVMIIMITSGIISGFLLYFLAEFISVNLFHSSDLIIYLKVFAFLIPFYLLANIFLSIIQGYEKISSYSFISNILQNFVKIFFLVFFIFIGLKNGAIIFSTFLGIFSMFLVGYIICRYKVSDLLLKYEFKDDVKKDIRKEFISYSWPILFLGVAIFIFSWTDSFFIGYFMDPFSVGLYNAAFTVAALMGFVPELFRQLFLPLITREYSNKNIEVINELSKQSAKWILMLNLPVFFILFTYPGLIVNVLFGAEYISSYNALRILAISGIFTSFSLLLTNMILMTGKSKVILSNLLVFSLMNIILNIFLVPLYGINGAALSTTLTSIGMSIALFIEVKHYTGIIPLKAKMMNIIIISIISISFIVLLRKFIENSAINIIFTGLFFILSYFCLLLLTNSFDRNDWMILKAIKSKILVSRNK